MLLLADCQPWTMPSDHVVLVRTELRTDSVCLDTANIPLPQLGVPYLEYDNSIKARTALSSAKSAMTILTEENKLLAERLAAVEKEKEELTEKLRRRVGNASVQSSNVGAGSSLVQAHLQQFQ